MTTPKSASTAAIQAEPTDFSLVLGGPLYQIFRRAHLSDDALFFLRRRIIVLALLTWAPLLVLSLLEGHAWSGSVTLPFIHDIEMQVRLLLAIPLLVVAELVVHKRMIPVVGQFISRGVIPDAARGQFDAAISDTLRLRNSVMAEVLLIVIVYGVGTLWLWRTQSALDAETWQGVVANGSLQPSLAGWWAGCVSMPLFQFLLLRWYYRLFLWAHFLWRVSRIQLNILPTHPDRCGGLGFLASVIYAFAPVLFAQGTVIAGVIANRIFYAGATLPEFKVELIGLVAFMVFTVLGPLLVFVPKLEAAKRAGLREYGILVQRYVREFDSKWLRGGAPAGEQLLGSADVQSLADMGGSFDVVREMKFAPFTLRTVLQLGIVTLLPVAPLVLTMFSLEDALTQLLSAIF